MQAADLKNPGQFTNAGAIRLEVAHAISQLENDKNPEPFLAAFLADAATKTPGYVAPEPDPLPATQVIVKSGDVVTLAGKTYTFTVAGGAITAVVVADA